ncbi:MAG TPA: UDP-glucuronic acid decarboxylase family protein [Patescibacteria group bacterium]|nr:UDP-glucuronic acid decarboxylase family protein [Patescibacteria group bacterium]
MHILVTGGAGFIGSHLCEKLLNSGHSVVGLDNLVTGARENIEHLLSNKRFKFYQRDINRPLHLAQKIDQIYNLACPASPIQYQKDPISTIKTNTLGMINVLEFALKHGARVLQASTSEVYGDPEVHPQVESYRGHVNPIGPRACYDEGKRCAETLCFDYRRRYGLDTKVVRIFNTYGPRMAFADGRVVSNFIIQALHGQGLTIFGKGNQSRSFCYVDDLVNGLVAMMKTNKKVAGPVNLGNPSEYQIKELAEAVIKLTGSKSKIVYRSLPEDDPQRRRPDISQAKKLLHWEPRVALTVGLNKTIVDFRKRLCAC